MYGLHILDLNIGLAVNYVLHKALAGLVYVWRLMRTGVIGFGTALMVVKAGLVAVKTGLIAFTIAFMALSVVQLIISGIGAALTFIITLLANILIVPAALIVAFMAIALIIPTITEKVLELGGSWENMWEHVSEWAGTAFIFIAGYLYNFRENMTNTMTWLKTNWNNLWTEMAARMGDAIEEGSKSALLHLELGITEWTSYLLALGDNVPRTGFTQEAMLGRMATIERNLLNPGLRTPPRLLTDLPPVNVNMPEHLLKQLTDVGKDLWKNLTGSGEAAGHGGTPGDQFKELALNRFILDQGPGKEGTGPQEVHAPRLEEQGDETITLLRRMLNLPPVLTR